MIFDTAHRLLEVPLTADSAMLAAQKAALEAQGYREVTVRTWRDLCVPPCQQALLYGHRPDGRCCEDEAPVLESRPGYRVLGTGEVVRA